jgi:PAS domain S-box-containing protein
VVPITGMTGSGSREALVAEAAARAGIGVVIAQLAPPLIVHANGVAADLLGFSEAELRAMAPLDLVAPEQRAAAAEGLQRRLAGDGMPAVALTVVRADGQRLTLEFRITDLAVEGRPGAAIFFTAPAAYVSDMAADARYRQLVDAAPDGVAITRGTRFLYANRLAISMTGCATYEELSQLSLADLLDADDLRTMGERVEAMLRDGKRLTPRDYVVRGRGRDVVVEVTSVPIDFEGGPAILAFLREVTEARRVQVELERAQRLAALGTLVAGVAHEVNNPLSFATLGTEVLRQFLRGDCRDLEEGHAALSNVSAALDRISEIVRDLRAFSRVDAPAPVPIELSEVLASALRMTAPTLRTRARLDVQLDQLPLVESSRGRLEQVFVNVLINAAQSFDSDQVSRNTLRIRASQQDGEVSVVIEDNGRGIPPEHLPHVFDPFFTTKPVGVGTGLGLSICHAIITQHGGRIEVEPAGSGGTRVTVVLRAKQRGEAGPSIAQPVVVQGVGRKCVLVVDDEPAIRNLLATLLESEHDVTIAAGGVEAEALLVSAKQSFDAVLCDVTMPDLSGVTLFERVCKARPDLRRRFAFMTGGLFDDEVFERVGGADTPRLEKPFKTDEVTALVQRLASGG